MSRGYRSEDEDGVPIRAVVSRLTSKAALIEHAGEEEWVPLSCIEEEDIEIDDAKQDLTIAAWKARELGWD